MATILEEELETYLFEWEEVEDDYEEHPIGVWGKCYRQVEIKGYGVLDLLYVDVSPGQDYPVIDIHIIELKKGNIDLSSLGQICRYKTGIERFIDKLRDKKGRKYFRNLNINGVLVGSDYSDGDICYAIDNIEWLSCYHYDLDLQNGITFEQSEGWYSKSESFKGLYKIIPDVKDDYVKFYKHELTRNK